MGTLTLVPEELFRGNGYGPAVAVGDLQGQSVQLKLSITRMMEEQTLEILIWGSVDGAHWSERPLATLPHRHYCGEYTDVIDLSRHPEMQFLRAEWRLRTWGPNTAYRLITFSMSATEEEHAAVLAAAAY